MSARSYLLVGHGGQGILDLGNFIAYDAILRGESVAYTPSYGPETRGGKVKCYVVRSEDDIDSPIVDEPDVLVAMNNPSMDFEPTIKPKGMLLMNTSLIDRLPARKDIETVEIPATEIADGMKNEGFDLADTRVLQNAVMYGAILATEKKAVDQEQIRAILSHIYPGTKSRFIPANLIAVERGDGFVKVSSRICELGDS